MSKTRVIVLAGFVIAFAAGAVVAMLAHRTVLDGPRRHMWLTQELNLTPAQSEQMEQIWSGVMRDAGRKQEEQHRALRKERDDAVAALLSPEQKAAYERIQQQYTSRMTELSQQRDKVVQDAVQKTRQILTDEQRAKYEELLKKRRPEGRGRGWRPEDRPATRPASE